MTVIEQCYELLSQEGVWDNGLVTVLAEIEIYKKCLGNFNLFFFLPFSVCIFPSIVKKAGFRQIRATQFNKRSLGHEPRQKNWTKS